MTLGATLQVTKITLVNTPYFNATLNIKYIVLL